MVILPTLVSKPLKLLDSDFSATGLKTDISSDWWVKIILKLNKHKTMVPRTNATNSSIVFSVLFRILRLLLLPSKVNNLIYAIPIYFLALFMILFSVMSYF